MFLAQLRGLTDGLPTLAAQEERTVTPPARQTQRRLTPGQLAELVVEYQAGAGMHKLAERWGVHWTTVAGHLLRAGVELRRQGLTDKQRNEAATLYSEGWSLQRLADRYNCDDETVRTYLRRAGVLMRWPERRH